MSRKRLFSPAFIQRFTSVHRWVGICTGMALFIAFFAGALAVYLGPIQKWANPDLRQAYGGMADIERVVDAAVQHADFPQALELSFNADGQGPKAVFYGGNPARGEPWITYTLALDASGQVVRLNAPSSVGAMINQIHYSLGLPKHAGYTLMGIVSAVYGLALVTGLLIHLPHLLRDLYSLRVGKNLKKMWLDAHNVIGVLSLPFHLMFAFTGLLICIMPILGDAMDRVSPSLAASQAFATQEQAGFVARRHNHGGAEEREYPYAAMLTASRLLDIATAQIEGFQPTGIHYSSYGTTNAQARVVGQVRRALVPESSVDIVAATGKVIAVDAPGRRSVPTVMEAGYVSLHFADFGGQLTKAIYFVLGLAGAFLFYSGNLLWIETRRRRHHVEQTMSGWVMAQLSIGLCLGCCLGIGFMLLGTQLLPLDLPGRGQWEENLYYIGFFGAVIWSLARPPIRAGIEILAGCAAVYGLLPILNVTRSSWHGDWDVALFDAILLLLAACFLALARGTMRRAATGQANSVWALSSRPLQHAQPRRAADTVAS
ncbi:PepSY-associated TM helix domain-containing protein [Thauera linaloolentis]|uniref:PepSY-associated TM helix domain-containing protein n=1 Tax=Thauera linaloolentis (strain DSM 12138 / JCM 21573 / CCUG 41526 / CIP 105981 / IAM 15112 / NBRC 102519 / 47Lol) TaxID=1123367 RepID=N6Y5W1_THAL4|nr:PepSY-associated TM helix domain-containing protein [Thauera linaloolentis]ENO86975.1 PepSY-associated TM helix domain-containing protein [Thauera linaloolentis 47Lol = DSM 12138]MCM8564435.1 PepSY domain-containing protein [Thauera linaloolentis]